MWRAEVSFRCLSQLLFILFFEVSHLTWRTLVLVHGLAIFHELQPSSCLCFLSAGIIDACCCLHLAVSIGSENQVQAIVLKGKPFPTESPPLISSKDTLLYSQPPINQ